MEAQIASASLNLTEKRPMNAGLMGQSFLTETESFPTGADSLANGARGWGKW